MHEVRVASRYAKSLIDLAKEKNILDIVGEDMKFFVKVSDSNPQLKHALQNPIVTGDKKLAILNSIFKGKVNDATLSLFILLVKKGREAQMLDIARQYIVAHRQLKGIQLVEVTTAFPLTDNIREDFKTMISQKEKNSKIELKEKVNKNILGGYILKIGDRQIDESVMSKLQKLKINFKDNSYISKL